MFYQVRVANKYCTYFRFLLWPDGNLQSELEEYQMVVHVSGAASSPSCSNFAFRKTAEDNSDHFSEEAVRAVKKNLYVDDCLESLSSAEEASHHASDLLCLLSRGGFRLTNKIGNDHRVLENIPEDEHVKDAKAIDLSKDHLPVERALGVKWCVETDTSDFKLKPPMRRGIVSVVSSIYDPFGLAALFLSPAKQLLHDLCHMKLQWDDPVPSQLKVRWEKWLADLPKLSQFSVSRCIKPFGFSVISSSQLQHFLDASEVVFDQFLSSYCQQPRRHSLLLALRKVTSSTFENDYDPFPRVICCNNLHQARQDLKERIRGTERCPVYLLDR